MASVQRTWADRPLGMRDVYPQFAKLRRQVESNLLDYFEEEDYAFVSCGAFEYVDTLLRGRPTEDAEDWVQLFDMSGRAIALRPDMTPSIARMAAPLVASSRGQVRWCYAERVYRRSNDPASLSWASGRAAESTQVGVEWIGQSGAAADCELLDTVRAAVATLGLSGWQMVASHAKFLPSFLQALEIPQADVHDLLRDLAKGDYVAFRERFSRFHPSFDLIRVLGSANPFVSDEFPALPVTWQDSEAGKSALAAWHELVELAEQCGARGLKQEISFDLTLCRDITYYTGLVFEVFAEGVGAPIALGGRYDDLLAQFGAPAPAIGFAFEVERLLGVITDGVWIHGGVGGGMA